MVDTLTLHEDPCSGNCHKIKLTAALLGIPLVLRQYDISKGETRAPEFLAEVNPHGRIPVLQVGDRFLPLNINDRRTAISHRPDYGRESIARFTPGRYGSDSQANQR